MAKTHSNKERFMLYQSGWKCGARIGAMDEAKRDDEDYQQGYEDGKKAYGQGMSYARYMFNISNEEAEAAVLRDSDAA